MSEGSPPYFALGLKVLNVLWRKLLHVLLYVDTSECIQMQMYAYSAGCRYMGMQVIASGLAQDIFLECACTNRSTLTLNFWSRYGA